MSLVADRKMTARKEPQPKSTAITAAQPTRPASPVSPCVAPAALTGVLLWASHFPLSWGWLGWVALVPFLTLVRAQASGKRLFWSAYLGGLIFFVPALQWMRVADLTMYGAWIALSIYLSIYFPLSLWLLRKLDRAGMPMCLSVPLIWVGFEWVRSFLLSGFAWFYLAHPQFRMSMLIQVADLGGVYAVSFLVAAVNGWLCDAAFQIPSLCARFHWREDKAVHQAAASKLRLGVGAAAVVALLASAIGYGAYRIDETPIERGPRIALLQTNVQAVRGELDEHSMRMVELQTSALPLYATVTEPTPKLVVWPETSFQMFRHYDIAKAPQHATSPEMWARQDDLVQYLRTASFLYPTQHLLGISTTRVDAEGKRTQHNTALLVDKRGDITGLQFDKIHCVPFGEYVPFRETLPFMKVFSPYENDYSITPGTKTTRFPLGKYRYGALICFEDSDAELARRYTQQGPDVKPANPRDKRPDDEFVDDGKPVDFLVNQSNDGWFGNTCEHEEHLAVSLFRAIETRRALVRSANTGISAVVDSTGRVLKPTPTTPDHPESRKPTSRLEDERQQKRLKLWNLVEDWQRRFPREAIKTWEIFQKSDGAYDELSPSEYAEFKGCSGVLFAYVPIDRRTTLYSQWGDWLPIGCWGTCAAILLVSAWRGRRSDPRTRPS